MTPNIPATARLANIRWSFFPCSTCGGDGIRRGVTVPVQGGGERRLRLDCRACRGLGFVRITDDRKSPTRNGGKQNQADGSN